MRAGASSSGRRKIPVGFVSPLPSTRSTFFVGEQIESESVLGTTVAGCFTTPAGEGAGARWTPAAAARRCDASTSGDARNGRSEPERTGHVVLTIVFL